MSTLQKFKKQNTVELKLKTVFQIQKSRNPASIYFYQIIKGNFWEKQNANEWPKPHRNIQIR